jgi:membrane-anchored mycosin MYCP
MVRRRPGWSRFGLYVATSLVAMLAPVGMTPTASAAPAECSTPSNTMLPGIPWTQTRLAPQRVWPLTNGRGIVVAVIDTGVDASAPQLAGRVLPGIDVVNGGGTADTDCFGHGTFVAGIIAAAPRSGTGVAGIAPGVTILPIRQANGPTDGTSSGLSRSILAAVDAGARVVNISATSFVATQELRAAVEYAQERDVLLVASASNEAERGNPKAYPASFPEVIGVGAIGPDGRRTSFSEVGESVDLVAPGTDIISLSRAAEGHLTDDGTSYSTPFVAAAAALVRAYYPKLSAAQVKRRLELTADHPPGPLPDLEVGWGVVNPYRAVTAVLPEEFGVGPLSTPHEPIAPISRVVPETRARDAAIEFAVAAGVAVLGAALLGILLPRGARRRWRPAGDPDVGRPT